MRMRKGLRMGAHNSCDGAQLQRFAGLGRVARFSRLVGLQLISLSNGILPLLYPRKEAEEYSSTFPKALFQFFFIYIYIHFIGGFSLLFHVTICEVNI